MARIEVVRNWDDEALIHQLRNPMRDGLGPDAYLPLIAEALARLLEAKREGK